MVNIFPTMLLNDPYYCYNEILPLEVTTDESLQMLMSTFAETTILPVPEAQRAAGLTYEYQAATGYGYEMQSDEYGMIPARSEEGYFVREDRNFVELLSMQEPAEQKCEWMHKNVSEWTPHDTKTWILDTAVEKKLKLSQIPSFQFSHISGVQLSNMTKEAFCENMSTEGGSFESILIGDTLYEALQSRLAQETLVPATITDKYKDPVANYIYNPEQTESEKRLYDMDSTYRISISPHPRNVNNLDSGYDSSLSEDCEPKYCERDEYAAEATPMEEAVPVIVKRPPGRPKGSGKKLTKRMKNVSVPEFLRDLLLNPSYCPRIIKWEDYSKGKFSFVLRMIVGVPTLKRIFGANNVNRTWRIRYNHELAQNLVKPTLSKLLGLVKYEHIIQMDESIQFYRPRLRKMPVNWPLMKVMTRCVTYHPQRSVNCDRFVKANEVAQLWGGKKNNKKMSFEKFSRAMRYHYKQGVLVSVPTARLVYQFGPKAPQYSTSNPNFEGSLSDR